jgi:phytoene dehydrogenase-like protein
VFFSFLQEVKEMIWDKEKGVQGVATVSGEEFRGRLVLSNATPEITYLRLLPKEALDPEFRTAIQAIDYKSPVTKINGRGMKLVVCNLLDMCAEQAAYLN